MLTVSTDELKILGSNGTTFLPGSTAYIAIIAGLVAGNNKLGSEQKFQLLHVIHPLCAIIHSGINAGMNAYLTVDLVYREMFIHDTPEEDEGFEVRCKAHQVAMKSFSDHLDLSADWIHLMADQRGTSHGK